MQNFYYLCSEKAKVVFIMSTALVIILAVAVVIFGFWETSVGVETREPEDHLSYSSQGLRAPDALAGAYKTGAHDHGASPEPAGRVLHLDHRAGSAILAADHPRGV